MPQDFPGSGMGRDLTSIWCKFNGKPVLIMTTHLESEKQSSDERKAQFNQVTDSIQQRALLKLVDPFLV